MKHRPRKRFGQNFLHDQGVIGRLVATIAPRPGETFIEIGPGHGALTRPLLATGAAVTAIEIDRDLAAELRDALGATPGFTLVEADALKADLGAVAGGGPFRLVGNLPYNISTPLLFHALTWRAAITDMHFMLQKEVVDRMAAAPGGKTYGRLSVMCQFACRVEPLFPVRPGAFTPPPAVESRIVRLVPHAQAPADPGDEGALDDIVRQAFSMRRKTLQNSLRGLLDADAIRSAGIDPGERPERLGLEAFAALARALHHERAAGG